MRDLSPLWSVASCRPPFANATERGQAAQEQTGEAGPLPGSPAGVLVRSPHSKMRFAKSSVIRATPERVFAFHEQPDVLSLLIPPWESARVIQAAKISEVGTEAIIETKIFGPITAQWVAQHTVYEPPRLFEDVQVKGPFRSWRHRHIIEPHAEGAMLRDEIDYEPPLGFLGRAFAPLLVQRRLEKLFAYRHDVTRRWCEGKEGK